MKLPENPTKKVRGIIATRLQCPGYKVTNKDLYKIKKVCDCLDTTIATLKLHSGDCCSLNNEVELFRGHWEDAEERCDELEVDNKKLKKDIVGWLNWCYYIPDSWKPKPMIEKSKQILKG